MTRFLICCVLVLCVSACGLKRGPGQTADPELPGNEKQPATHNPQGPFGPP